MIGRIRSRLSSAHVIAFVALVLAVTGTSVALPGQNSVDTGDIKANAVTSSDIRQKTIKGGDVGNNALGANQIKESSLAEVPTAASASNVHWAVVSNPPGASNATLVRSSQPAPTVTEAAGVIVAFSQDVTGCTWLATRGATGAGVETNGYAQTGGAVGNPNGVDVRTRQPDGTITDGNFHLLVVCP
jgi:hypothetical protein